MKKKGIEMDYGKPERFLFLERDRQYNRMERWSNLLLVLVVIYLGYHIIRGLW
jgi:hypothetical protein